MRFLEKALLYGFLVWLIPFVVAFLIYPIHETNRPLFESIMPVLITFCVVLFSLIYFRNIETQHLREGVLLGVIWFFISLVIDLFMFMEGPMKMEFLDYMADIGVTYILIPIITIGYGLIAKRS